MCVVNGVREDHPFITKKAHMKAQLTSHDFKTFTSAKNGKTYEINVYQFYASIKGVMQTVVVEKFGPKNLTMVVGTHYEIEPEAWVKDFKLQFSASISPAATQKA